MVGKYTLAPRISFAPNLVGSEQPALFSSALREASAAADH